MVITLSEQKSIISDATHDLSDDHKNIATILLNTLFKEINASNYYSTQQTTFILDLNISIMRKFLSNGFFKINPIHNPDGMPASVMSRFLSTRYSLDESSHIPKYMRDKIKKELFDATVQLAITEIYKDLLFTIQLSADQLKIKKSFNLDDNYFITQVTNVGNDLISHIKNVVTTFKNKDIQPDTIVVDCMTLTTLQLQGLFTRFDVPEVYDGHFFTHYGTWKLDNDTELNVFVDSLSDPLKRIIVANSDAFEYRPYIFCASAGIIVDPRTFETVGTLTRKFCNSSTLIYQNAVSIEYEE